MKITKLLTFAMALGVLIFSSCSENDLDGVNLPSEGIAEVSISLRDASGNLTRSFDTDGGYDSERAIENITFFIFEADGSRDAEFPTFRATEETVSRYTFPVTAGSKQILVGLNIGSDDIAGDLETVKAEIYSRSIQTPALLPNAPIAGGIPMTGEKAIHVPVGSVTNATIAVERLYARFNPPATEGAEVNFTEAEIAKLADILGADITGEIEFEFNGYVVINGIKKSFLFPTYGVDDPITKRWDSLAWYLGADTDNYTASEYVNKQLGRVYSGTDFLTTENVYLYENSPLYITPSGSHSGYSNKTVYAMIIEGKLWDSANPSNKATRYWRVNVSKTNDETRFQILRNSIYKVNIQTVTTVGYETPEEGEEDEDGGGDVIPGADDATLRVVVDIVSWKVFTDNQDI